VGSCPEDDPAQAHTTRVERVHCTPTHAMGGSNGPLAESRVQAPRCCATVHLQGCSWRRLWDTTAGHELKRWRGIVRHVWAVPLITQLMAVWPVGSGAGQVWR
jgi:hypothetical protein